MNCEPEVVGRLHVGNARSLPFPDKSFKAALAINVIHNLTHDECLVALSEISRITTGGSYVQVDAYKTESEKQLFLDWVLTAKTYGTPEFWQEMFKNAEYSGDYYWTVLE